ncbi:MAG: helix-turn-helix domain-containing protein [Polyangiaceae bacterium]
MPRAAIRVEMILMEGLFASALAVTTDVLATANIVGRALAAERAVTFEWRLRTVDGGSIRSSAGSVVASDGKPELDRADIVFVFGPGMADASRVLCDVERLDARALVPMLQGARDRALITASCSSTFLLAEAGLLDGGQATTSWWLAALFRARYPRVKLRQGEIVCAAGNVWTAGAAMAQLDLALAVVRRFAGYDVAHACAQYLVIDEARVSQAPYLVVDHLSRHDELVANAERWMSQHLERTFDLEELARALDVHERTLARRFVSITGLSPMRFARRLRIETAGRLLATTSLSIAAIAARVGYEDERAFRRAFAEQMKRSPSAHRRAHRRRAAGAAD